LDGDPKLVATRIKPVNTLELKVFRSLSSGSQNDEQGIS
jgi:hypothetical protein